VWGLFAPSVSTIGWHKLVPMSEQPSAKKSALPPARLGLIAIAVLAILGFVASRGGTW
jgi:hypothetical protein